MIKIEQMRSSVTEGDDEKLETLTAPNPRPLLVRTTGNSLRNQCGNARRRLVHNTLLGPHSPTLMSDIHGHTENDANDPVADIGVAAAGRFRRCDRVWQAGTDRVQAANMMR